MHNIRNKKLLKNISKLLIALTFISFFFPFQNLNSAKAIGINTENSNKEYEVLNNITWSRTPDIKGDSDNVEGTPRGGLVDTRTQSNGRYNVYSFNNTYWSTSNVNGTNVYTLDKNPNNAKGILQTTKLFNYAYNGNTNKNKVVFDYNTLTSILNPTQTNDVWDGKTGNYYSAERINMFKSYNGIPISNAIPSSYNDFSTWFYKRTNNFVDNYNNSMGIVRDSITNWQRQGDQLRLFRGEFTLTQDEIDNYDYYVGIGENNPELILPIDDTMFVLVDEKVTGINFTSSNEGNNQSLYIKNGSEEQEIKFNHVESCNDWSNTGGLAKTCSDPEHKKLSGYADGLHAHLQKYLNEDGTTIANISSILKNAGAGNHKIDIFASDYNKSGGMGKLEIIRVKKPEVTVEKEALINDGKDNKVIASSISNGISYTGTVLPNQKVDYRLTYNNEGSTTVKDIVFNDKSLGITISKDSYKLNGNNINDLSTLTITNGEVTKTGKEALQLLSSLEGKTKITVMDSRYLTKTPSDIDINTTIPNTVTVGSTYFNGNSTGDKETTVNVEVSGDRDVTIEKYIKKVVRNNSVIYKGTSKVQKEDIPRIYSGDKITFGFKVTNNENVDVTGLSLKDIIKSSDGKIIDDGRDFTFRSKIDSTFTGDNFEVRKNSYIEFESNEWIVPSNARYILDNNIDLLGSNSEVISSDNADFIVYPRVYVKMFCDKDDDKQFYVTITGNDGFKTGMYLRNGESVEVDNLNYNVDYVVTETIPMNFTFEGIDINNKNKVEDNLTFNLMTIEDPSTINLYNTKTNSTNFRDDDEVTNKLGINK
ncbi:MAG: hypothetical protein GX275_04645 [Clostridiales bacterium]|nr:hypothetical protein [Clostridiales bacterium]